MLRCLCQTQQLKFLEPYPVHLYDVHVPVLGLHCLRIQLKDTTEKLDDKIFTQSFNQIRSCDLIQEEEV